MPKKLYLLAMAAYLLGPVTLIAGTALASFIDPELARHLPDYGFYYRFIELLRNAVFSAFVLASLGLWFLSGFLLLKSKSRSYRWLPLALLGPFGFIALAMLDDKEPATDDGHQRFIERLKLPVRIAYELVFLVASFMLAYQAVVLKRDLLIMREAAATGISTVEIIERQNASSGMYAFGEGLEELFLVVLIYLLWPLCFNAARHLLRSPRSGSKS